MQVIILAVEEDPAGGPLALVELAGRALIDYALAFARAVGADHRITVAVAGAGHAALARRLGARDPDAVVVEDEPGGGDLLSFLAGRGRLEPGGFLLLRTGRIYEPRLAPTVARAAALADEVTAFCHRDRDAAGDKVRLDAAGRLAEIAADLADWQVGYAGLTFVPAARVPAHGDAARRALGQLGESAPVEAVLSQLAASGTPPHIADISSHAWLEVDGPEKRDDAAAVLFSRKWWT